MSGLKKKWVILPAVFLLKALAGGVAGALLALTANALRVPGMSMPNGFLLIPEAVLSELGASREGLSFVAGAYFVYGSIAAVITLVAAKMKC